MGEKRRWLWPSAGILVIFLTLWGWWGEGSASKLLPEPAHSQTAVVAEEVRSISSEESATLRRYDASVHVRRKPLKDPFHGAAVTHKGKETNASASYDADRKGKETSRDLQEIRKEKNQVAPSVDKMPHLQGVMSFGQKKRAVVEWNGSSYTVGEGEQVGLWTVSAINGKTVTLTAASGNVLLSTR